MNLTGKLIYLLCLAMTSCQNKSGLNIKDTVSTSLDNSFIWADSSVAPQGKQVYIAFRKTFDLPEMPLNARLSVFADSRYKLWINGHYVESGPCRFDPRRPEYDVHDVHELLKTGRNAIVVLVHSYVIGGFTKWNEQCARIMDHRPGLTARFDYELPGKGRRFFTTDRSWKLNANTRFGPSPGTYSSIPDNIDARLDDGDWTSVEYDDNKWITAEHVKADLWGPLHERSIPMLRQQVIDNPTIIEPADKNLPLDVNMSQMVLIDFGRTMQAYTILDFDAETGSELELVHCSRYRETGLKPEQVAFTGDNFRDRYIARSGRQTYICGDTWGGRYLLLVVRSGRIRVHGIKAVDRTYPFTRLGHFNSNDEILNRIWDISLRTVEVCSEDAHVDCADRERAQWMADGYMMGWPVSRIALAGPGNEPGQFQFSDSRLIRNMLRHIGLSQLPDGRLQPMRPSSYPPDLTHGVIDDYSCLWIQALREYYDITGDDAFVRELWPVLIKTLNYFLERQTQNGLIKAMEFIYFKNPLIYKICEGTSINCYIYRSLKDAEYLGNLISEKANSGKFSNEADKLLSAINSKLWDETSGSYSGGIIDGVKQPPTGHAATIALYFGIVPDSRRNQVFAYMKEHLIKEEAFPYTYRYFFDVLYWQNTPDADQWVLDLIREKWRHMTLYETGTTSEDWRGGSFIHESGAHPAWFLSSYVLGVRMEGPRSDRRLLIEPHLGDLDHAEGTVLCEYGPVSVTWTKTDGGTTMTFILEIPEGHHATVHIPIGVVNKKLIVDGSELVSDGGSAVTNQVRFEGHFASLELEAGRHTGESSLK